MSNKRTRADVPDAPTPGRARQKLRTRKLLLATAKLLISEGRRPSVTEVADAAGVSRRTAYRYFPTQAKLLTDAALDGLRPLMEAAIAAAPQGLDLADAAARVAALVTTMQSLAIENETLLRTMIHETVLHGVGTEQPRGGRRLEWIELAIKPLRAELGAIAYGRLLHALALCTGIEAVLVLRDICRLTPAQAVEVSQWMALAVLRQSRAERRNSARPKRRLTQRLK